VWRVRRSPDLLRRAVAAAALIAFAYWFVHAAGDWLFAIPAVSGPAFAWLGMAVALASAAQPLGRVTLAASAGSEDEEQAPAPTPGPSGRRPRLVAVAAVMCTLAMLAAIVPPWLAANATDEAVATWRSDAPAAFDLLERARGLNVLSDQPDLLQGVIASRLGDRPRARRSFARAVRRSPLSWYGRQQLGLEEALAGRRRSSLWQLERARVLNPREDTTRTVLREVRANRRPSPAKVRAVFIDRICARVPTAQGC